MNKRAKQLTVLSVKSLKAHTWLYARLALAFAVMVFLLCLFSAYSLALNGMQADILAEHAAANQIVSSEPISGLPDGTESFVAKRYDAGVYIDNEEGGDEIEDDVEDGGFVVRPHVSLYLTLSVEGEEHTREEWSTYYDYNKVFASPQLLTDNDRAELKRMHATDDVLTGRMPQADNEAVVAERFLDMFELTGDEVLGKTISFVASVEENTVQINNIVVCGILKRRFHLLSGRDDHVTFCPYLLLSQDNPIFTDSERVKDVYVYSLPYWMSEEQIDSITEQYDCWFVGHSWLDDMVRLSIMQTIATKLFVVVGGALVCSVVLMIFLMLDKLIAVFSRDCGILLSCGMQFKQARLLLLTLFAWVCLFAVVIAAILTLVGVLAINAAIFGYFHMQITLSVGAIFALFGIGLATVALIALIYYLYAASRMKRRSIKDFLNTSID